MQSLSSNTPFTVDREIRDWRPNVANEPRAQNNGRIGITPPAEATQATGVTTTAIFSIPSWLSTPPVCVLGSTRSGPLPSVESSRWVVVSLKFTGSAAFSTWQFYQAAW
jgi:hypothetical protein